MDQYGRRRLHRFLLLEVRRFLNTTSSNDQTIKCKQRGFYNHLSFKGRGPSGYIYILRSQQTANQDFLDRQ